jgi:Uma2 family endonuclease
MEAATITIEGLEIPMSVGTFEGFRRWVATLDEQSPRVSFAHGSVHIELSPQDHRTHGPVSGEINRVVSTLVRDFNLGWYYMPPSWFTDVAFDLSTEPDGFLVLWESFENGRVRINPERSTELLGSPDWVLEVVSNNSVKKDLHDLYAAYEAAGIREYWIADAGGASRLLRIFSASDSGRFIESSPDTAAWARSDVFARAFRLTSFSDRAGLPDYRLEIPTP